MIQSKNPSAIRSQKEITEALIGLMHEYPYDEISVKQILLESKLARKTFYRNFDSKDDVLISLIRSVIRDYFSVVDSGRADVGGHQVGVYHLLELPAGHFVHGDALDYACIIDKDMDGTDLLVDALHQGFDLFLVSNIAHISVYIFDSGLLVGFQPLL